MQNQESSISIINKNNGSITGENAAALPIKIQSDNVRIKYFILGLVVCQLVNLLIIYSAQVGVDLVKSDQRASEYNEYSI